MQPPDNLESIPDSLAVVNGKRYSLWPQFVNRKAEWIGGELEDLEGIRSLGKRTATKITDITFKANEPDSAFFEVVGEEFGCGADVQYLGIDGDTEPGWLTFCTQFGSGFRIRKPVQMKEFFFTFGQNYVGNNHPRGGHKDGWFTIVAKDS